MPPLIPISRWILLVLLFFPLSGITTSFSEKDTHSTLGSPERIAKTLESLQKTPQETSSYYYNLGTLYGMLGELGKSVAYLEKSNQLNPHDSAIQHNLLIAQNKLGSLIGTDQLDPSSSAFEKLADRISLQETRGALGLLGWIIVLLWIRTYRATHQLKKTLWNPAGLFSVLGFMITVGLYGIQRWANAYPVAVCLERQYVRSGPGHHYLEMAQLPAGTKIRLLGASQEENSQNWKQVRYSLEGVGWVETEHLLVLK